MESSRLCSWEKHRACDDSQNKYEEEDGHFASLVPTLDIARKACKLRILVASALTVYGIPNLRFSTGT